MTDDSDDHRTTHWRRAFKVLSLTALMATALLSTTSMFVFRGPSCHKIPREETTPVVDNLPLPPPSRAAVIAPGVEKPLISLGTGGGMVGNRSVVRDAVATWLEIGGTGIDTAIDYDNDDLVGLAMEASGVPRETIFLTTKQPGPIGYDATIEALEQALVRLRTTYVDLYLIHFPDLPNASEDSQKRLRQDTWRGMEEVLKRGWTRSIGVSNYAVQHLEETLEAATLPPAVNQVLWNPVQHDDALLVYCQSKGITLEAWSPLGGHNSRHGSVLSRPELQKIAADHGVTSAQVALRWTLQHGMTLATGTTSRAHMETDRDVFGFRLTDQEMAKVSNLPNTTLENNLNAGVAQ